MGCGLGAGCVLLVRGPQQFRGGLLFLRWSQAPSGPWCPAVLGSQWLTAFGAPRSTVLGGLRSPAVTCLWWQQKLPGQFEWHRRSAFIFWFPQAPTFSPSLWPHALAFSVAPTPPHGHESPAKPNQNSTEAHGRPTEAFTEAWPRFVARGRFGPDLVTCMTRPEI